MKHLGIRPEEIIHWQQIPCLPVELFKSHSINIGDAAEITFESSRTSGEPSLHPVHDLDVYRRSLHEGFSYFYDDEENYDFIALLPSYLERNTASLVYMCRELINMSSGAFFKWEYEEVLRRAQKTLDEGRKTPLIIGVTFALLEMASKFPVDLSGAIVMETGGMKGRGPELIRSELHERLQIAWRLDSIHSEYGMTELLSQAYSRKSGVFETPPWMKVWLRDLRDPLATTNEKRGLINIVDLANVYSCPFIATQDIGKWSAEGGFEVLGRSDSAEIRGCNLLFTP